MLTQAGCLARRERLWNSIPEIADWVLVADPRHVQYLANFWVEPLSFSGGERGLLLLERSGQATLLADNFAFRSAAHEPYIDREIIEDWYDHRRSVRNRDHALRNAVRRIADELRERPGLIEAEWLPVSAWMALDVQRESYSESEADHSQDNGDDELDLGTILRRLRRHKELDEIELLKQCMRAGDAGQARLREVVRPGVSEHEVYCEVQRAALLQAGRPGLVYGDFRCTSPDVPKAGGLPTDHVLAAGELFILDYSIVLDGYRSDFTNTLAVGEPSDPQVMLFELCEAAMRAGEDALTPGVPARDVYAAVSRPFEEAGYPPLPHHAGHGIGLAHPEPPILVPESDDELIAGDVVTLEPGIYQEGIGGMRIEHNYLITNDGYERLSNHDISLT